MRLNIKETEYLYHGPRTVDTQLNASVRLSFRMASHLSTSNQRSIVRSYNPWITQCLFTVSESLQNISRSSTGWRLLDQREMRVTARCGDGHVLSGVGTARTRSDDKSIPKNSTPIRPNRGGGDAPYTTSVCFLKYSVFVGLTALT